MSSWSRIPLILRILAVLLALTVIAVAAYQTPFVEDHLGWRISALRARIKYAFSPPELTAFTPNPTIAAMVQETLSFYTPSPTLSQPSTPTPGITATPTPTPTPLPESVQLEGFQHEYQRWNNCGPANLAMALSYWGWSGTQSNTEIYLKPNDRDKNVMPSEMAAYVNDQTELNAILRVGGDLDLLRSMLAAGFPVLIEKGFEGPGFDGWMGHYGVVSGYDDALQLFTIQDSYYGPNRQMSYSDLELYWRHFNFAFLVIYPDNLQSDVLTLLGPRADEQTAFEMAAEQASLDIYQTTGREQYFAWFNRGASLAALQDYGGAAAAFDEAFLIDASLAAAQDTSRAWRMLWYDTGPYRAYYYTGRYYEVINLATLTLNAMSEPVLEESYYWRAMSKLALGDTAGAIVDLRAALRYHEGWQPAIYQLEQLGAAP